MPVASAKTTRWGAQPANQATVEVPEIAVVGGEVLQREDLRL